MGARPEPAILALMLPVVTWVGGFDVLYSLQDERFRPRPGLHSIPARFGTSGGGGHFRRPSRGDGGFAALSGVWLGCGTPFFWASRSSPALLVYEHALVGRGNLERSTRAFFDINGYVSCAFFALTALDAWLIAILKAVSILKAPACRRRARRVTHIAPETIGRRRASRCVGSSSLQKFTRGRGECAAVMNTNRSASSGRAETARCRARCRLTSASTCHRAPGRDAGPLPA